MTQRQLYNNTRMGQDKKTRHHDTKTTIRQEDDKIIRHEDK